MIAENTAAITKTPREPEPEEFERLINRALLAKLYGVKFEDDATTVDHLVDVAATLLVSYGTK